MGGADVIDVEGEDDPPPPPPRPVSRKTAPHKGTPSPPPPPPSKAPRTATPVKRTERAERAKQAAGRGQRGAVHEWVEQQQQLQRAGAWEARAISAEAANRDLGARLSRTNEDRRGAKSRLAEVTKERDRLVARVKTQERDLGTAGKAKPPAQAGEGPQGAEAPPGDRAAGGGGGGGGAVLPVSGTLWPAQRPGMRRPRHAPARCRRCPPACGWP